MRPKKLGLDYIPKNLPSPRNKVRAVMIGGLASIGLYDAIMEEMCYKDLEYVTVDWVKGEFDLGLDKGNIDSLLEVLTDVSLISITDGNISVPEASELLNHVKLYRNNERERKRESKKNNEESNNPGTHVTDYKKLVQMWDKKHPMTETQLRTSYSRLKSKSDWDPNKIVEAIEYLSYHTEIKNRVLCDWYENGLFASTYVYDAIKINAKLNKKGDKYPCNDIHYMPPYPTEILGKPKITMTSLNDINRS